MGGLIIIYPYSMMTDIEEIESKNAKVSGFPKGQLVPKVSTYNKEKYQANKDKILQYRKKRYKELNAYKYDIQINQGNFIISFD